MKFNGIDFDKLSNTELINLCLKYNLIDKSKQYDFNLSFFLKLFISIPLLLFLTSCGSRTPTGLDQETIKSQSKKDYDELKGLFPLLMSWSSHGWIVEDVKKKETDQMSLF